ncbi:MAG: thioredoxin [Bacteroidales bacterium]|jgi:thioredoxin 1|nr:thioredoxin [Bacteroidales bacterium]MDD2571023.1 thioredoxin [Bacteroidales bacterium]MDD2813162.1 thioredoxin [Bacteroidales bacterium]MDD3384493.1 thioredoxin [Bacteroidales bacterium]MDD3812165.1 thioredoxin [Bacteroidales bacterium]
MTLELTDSNFQEMIVQSDKPAVVDFWAEWCGPCRMITPIVKELSQEYDGRVVIGKVDVDNNPGISATYGIRNIPTLLFFKNGVVVDKQVGVVPKGALVQKIEALLK